MSERDRLSMKDTAWGVTHMQIVIKRSLTLEQRIESPRMAANLMNINTNTQPKDSTQNCQHRAPSIVFLGAPLGPCLPV